MSTFLSRRSLPQQPTVSSTSLASWFLICLKFCIIWSLFHSVIFSDAAALPEKCTQQITYRWWITISAELPCIYMHFKVLHFSLVSCLNLFLNVAAKPVLSMFMLPHFHSTGLLYCCTLIDRVMAVNGHYLTQWALDLKIWRNRSHVY